MVPDVRMAPRRVVAVAVAGALALTALAGCRVEAGSAAYVGADRITDAQVDRLVKEFENLDSVKGRVENPIRGSLREQALSWLVLVDAGRRYAAAHNLNVPRADLNTVMANGNFPEGSANTEFGRLAGDVSGVMSALQTQARSTPPSDADKHEVYNYLAAQGAVPPYDQVSSYFTQDSMGTAVGLRDVLRDVVKQEHITISPRYGAVTAPIPVTIGNTESYLQVSMQSTPANSAVVDAA